jgi:hypothetical protein
LELKSTINEMRTTLEGPKYSYVQLKESINELKELKWWRLMNRKRKE